MTLRRAAMPHAGATPWADDLALAIEAASRGASVLRALRGDGALAGEALGRAGDKQANAAIVQLLRRERPADGLLSEEQAPDAARLARRRVWIVDPLDGTREYAEAGARVDWAVHVALCIDGAPAAAVVALPALGEMWTSAPARTVPALPPGRWRIAVSRTRAPAFALRVADRLDAELVPMGSAGAKVAAVLRGEVHAYLHAGGMHEWDACAPVGVALAHGLHASRLDGSACRFNQPEPSTPDLLVCRRECAEKLLAAAGER
ncbi:MAG: inositol monophosphatase family protein [Burkholderiaceae bacterium]